MLKALGKWVAKKAVGEAVGGLVRIAGGGTVTQEMAKIAANEAMDRLFD